MIKIKNLKLYYSIYNKIITDNHYYSIGENYIKTEKYKKYK